MRQSFLKSLRTKLFLAHLLVILVGVGTLYLAATLIAPGFFQRHVADMVGMHSGMGFGGPFPDIPAIATQQLADAFRGAMSEALRLAVAAAILAAMAASLVVSQSLGGRIQRLADASRRIAAGHYAERVAADGQDELGQLARSFNDMAEALNAVERRRTELIGDVAHELRTPIATIEGYLEGLLDGIVAPSEETWARLSDEAGRLHRLADDLQALSRAEAHQLALVVRPTAPSAIIEPAVHRLEPDFAAKGIILALDVQPGLPLVQADPDRAVQALSNLLTNALRYTPAPGRVDLRVDSLEGASRVRFRVQDSGIGIATEDLQRVFERFYRVEKSRARALGGTGVGLTIAKALVEAMNGRIWAESTGLGEGAIFSFELPIAAQQRSEQAADGGSPASHR
jgi:signal transduction histidine kinase